MASGTALVLAMGTLPIVPATGAPALFEVGEGKPYETIGSVPWEALSAGDTVLIHWRPEPYREKWVIGRRGEAANPITVRGIPGPGGQLPVVDGENATTREQLDYWGESRSVIKIGGSSVPPETVPSHIIIADLDVRGARPPNTFTDDQGILQTYASNAAAIHVEIGENIVIRGCTLRDCGNGLFVSSTDTQASRDILIEGNHIHGNGNDGSIYHHNTYTAAIGIVYQFNRFGPLLVGASGNNLKDRSAGLVVRYNWIEGGNRQLDLVDGEDSVLVRTDPAYAVTLVYGNVLIEPAGAGNRQIVHYGGDSGSIENYRKGKLHFYHNTLVSTRTDRTALLRLSTEDEFCDARNNILYVAAAGSMLGLDDGDGTVEMSHNWLKPGWVHSFGGSGTVVDDGTSITGTAPGFWDEATQRFELTADSACVDAATALHPDLDADDDVVRQYVTHAASKLRQINGPASDLGAFELRLPFDFDADGGADLGDLHGFASCMAGPGAAPAPPPPADAATCLDAFDRDGDQDVDLLDFVDFQAVLSGRE